jgi:hypothetical protein
VELNAGLPGAFPRDFDLSPSNTTCTGAKGLHHGFFRGKPGCELWGSTTAICNLIMSVNTLQEAVAKPFHGIGDPTDFDDVDADGNVLQSSP